MTTIGILSIGQMGLGIARLLLAHGFSVITNVSDRTSATQERARSASIGCASSDAELVAKADYILSIVPPRDALSTAARISSVFERDPKARLGKEEPLYYLDLNAVSPDTARKIGSLFQAESQVHFIDGGIIGGPPALPSGTSTWTRPGIPLSGPHTLPSAHLSTVLNTNHISSDIGTASGLKCVFAGLSKGFAALAVQSFTTASSLGVLPHLQDYIAQYNPSVKERAGAAIVGCQPKAYRWVEEMDQIGQCFAMDGGWPDDANVFRNVAKVFETVARVVEESGGAEGENLEGALKVLTGSLNGTADTRGL